MMHSIATLTLGGPLREKLTAIAAAGFNGVEIVENDLESFKGTARDVRKIAADLGLTITLFQPFRDFEGMSATDRDRKMERAKEKFEQMHLLGTDLLLVCSNISPKSAGGIDRAAEDFYLLGELASAHAVRVGFEALSWGRHIHHYQDAWEVVKRANHASVGLILDSFHILACRHDLSVLLSVPSEKIFLVQLADAPFLSLDIVIVSRHFRHFPGYGQLPLTDFVKVLHATGYKGCYSLEIFNDELKATPADRVAKQGFQALVTLLKQAGKKTDKRLCYGL
jgi:4-hydroxyphenylpyruvate dioxygenase